VINPESLNIVTPATVEPVSLAEMRVHLRIVDTAEDDLIGSLVTAARQYIEAQTQLAIATQTYRLTLDAFPTMDVTDLSRPATFGRLQTDSAILLPRGPATSVTSITYVDQAGATITLSPSLYRTDTDSLPPRITPAYNQHWPVSREVTGAVRVTFIAGYTVLPSTLRAAIKLLAAHLYINREPTLSGTIVASLPFSLESLITNHRVQP